MGSSFPNRGSNLCPLQWRLGVLTTGPSGKFLKLLFKYYFFKCKFIYLQNFVIEKHVIFSYFSARIICRITTYPLILIQNTCVTRLVRKHDIWDNIRFNLKKSYLLREKELNAWIYNREKNTC